MPGNNLEKIVAEHFTCFLVSKGYVEDGCRMNKKKLKDVFKDEYMPLYHVRMKPYLILLSLVRNKYVKRRQKSTSDIVYFNISKVQQIASRHGERGQDPLPSPPPPDKSVTSPVMKVYVMQQHAFQIGDKRPPAATSIGCSLCSVNFANKAQYEAHTALESHIVKEAYRSNRKLLYSKCNIVVSCAREDLMGEITVRENSVGSVSITVSNRGTTHYDLLKILVLCELNEIEGMLPELPHHLKPGGCITFTLDYEFHYIGAYIYPLVLKLDSKGTSSYILKELVFHVHSELLDYLKPSSPYKRPLRNVMKHSEGPVLYGKPPPEIPSKLVSARRLPHYELPAVLRRVINHGFKPFENMSPADIHKLKEVKSLLEKDAGILLKQEKYTALFRLLLYIEEHQMDIDIRMYDRDNQTMQVVKEDKNLLSLQVPGLSENRPSVIRGDVIYVVEVGDSVKYGGMVHRVRESEVWLDFHRALRDKYVTNMKFRVEFQFSRRTLRSQHRALEMVKHHGITHHLFPSRHTTVPLKNVNIISWFNKKLLSGNPQQQQAVQNIVSGTSYPAPYLIFGPPGTGKTVTVVEAVTQLYHLNKHNGHILVCAPSNSAANEVTRRLLMSCQGHIPDSDILRLYAFSYNHADIPEQLKKCCNYAGDEYFYPSQAEIMKYAVVVVTLATATRLVNACIPPGHFSHLFIDESGQAVEPEALIPIAGLFSSEKEKGKLLGQLVLAGDPKQLGPVLRSPVAINFGLGTSLLERLMQCDLYKRDEKRKLYNPAVLTKLVQNFRSHEKILALPDRLFYDSELKACGDSSLTSLACNWEGLPKRGFPLIFHGVKGKDQREENSPSFFNIQEIEVIKCYVERLLEDRFHGRKLKPEEIGVITPYRKQVEKIKKLFKKLKWGGIHVGSVEDFQGQERLVIIISTVRSTWELVKEDYKFHLGFLKNPKRFNVALTRSKALLIAVGDPDILQLDKHWRELILYCKEHGGYTGCPLMLRALPQQVEDLTSNFSSLQIDAAGSRNTDDPRWRSDI